jgi:hypothetical protein
VPDKVQDLVYHPLGRTIVPNASRQSFTQPEPTIGRRQQYCATVGAASLLVEPNHDLTLRQILE